MTLISTITVDKVSEVPLSQPQLLTSQLVHFIMNDFKQAAANYNKSTHLDDKFVFSHIQLAVAQYKEAQVANSMATFRKTLKAFPERSEPPNY